MKDSEILRKAREMIASSVCDRLCESFYRVAEREKALSLYEWVNSMLADAATLYRWLSDKHGIHPPHVVNGPIRETRLRWLDWMIQYCELEEAGWTPWLGGETPPETCSAALLRDRGELHEHRHGNILECRWTHLNTGSDIIAYKP